MNGPRYATATAPAAATGATAAPAATAAPEPGPDGRAGDPRWARPAFWALLLATAALYLVNLDSSGWANSFYSAAVQAGSLSWKAFFFGSSDAANFITVDKPPASLWPMALSVRLFGLNSWAILVPQALMGVGTVAVLHAAVRRRFGAAAGLVAGGVLALTPVAVLMFRFNNPDALLTLLSVCAVYAVQRALEAGSTKWLVWAGAFVGFAFLAKTLQAFLILPPLALVYACCAPVRLRRRIGQLALAAAALVVTGGWWVAIVELWPASSRPYIGGSQHNSFLELTFGYNGFGRLNGNETGSVGGMVRALPGGDGPALGGGMWGQTGITRLFNAETGGQISWLLPAALLLVVAGTVATRRALRTDAQRSAFLLWSGSLLVTAAVFSYMAGIFHPYYNVALAPYIAAVVGMGGALLWERRRHPLAALTLAAAVAVTAVWSYELLGRSPHWFPWLRWAVAAGGIAAALGLALPVRRAVSASAGRATALTAVVIGLGTALAGPAAYAADTVATGHTGSLPSAGPASAGFPGGRPGLGVHGGFPGAPKGAGGTATGPGVPGPGVPGPGVPGPGVPGPGVPGPGVPGPGGRTGTGGTGASGKGMPGGPGLPGAGGARRGGPAVGGLLDGARVGSAIKALLSKDADRYTWVAAAVGSQNQAAYQLATGHPVMAIGGFNGSDPAPTLARFKQLVAEGRVHYFIGGAGMGAGMGASGAAASAQIDAWVSSTFHAKTVGGVTVYDLTAPK